MIKFNLAQLAVVSCSTYPSAKETTFQPSLVHLTEPSRRISISCDHLFNVFNIAPTYGQVCTIQIDHAIYLKHVFSCVSPIGQPVWMHSHTGCIYLAFRRCVSSNDSLICLPQRMHSRIGCICLAFLHCVFSNVSSNDQPEWMQIHTGCICLSFPHCVFSNVSSNGPVETMHTHTGCIYLVILHCALLYVSSKYLHMRMHSCIACINVT